MTRSRGSADPDGQDARHETRSAPKRPVWLGVILLGLILAGCGGSGALSVKVDLTLYAAERWAAQVEIVFADQQIQFLGAQIDQAMMDLVTGWQDQGLRVSHDRRTLENGNVAYDLTVGGVGLERLNTALFDGQATLVHDATFDPPQIRFRYLPLGTLLGAALSREFTLTGGEVLETNGIAQSKRTTTWVNPTGEMVATVTPAPALNESVLLIAAIGATVGLTGFGVWRITAKVACANCGARIYRRATFCTACGQERR